MNAPTLTQTLNPMRRAAAWLALLLAALILAACGDDDSAVEPTARATLGAAGGNLSSPDGSLVLTIPAGALGNDTEITITEVAADAVPEHLKAINADRVYRLGPAGTQFAQPLTASVALAAGNQLAVMLIDSNGATTFADNQQVRIDAQGRRILGELTHFSHLVARTVGNYTGELVLDKRELKVGDSLNAVAVLSRLGDLPDADEFRKIGIEDGGGVATCTWFPGTSESTFLEPDPANPCPTELKDFGRDVVGEVLRTSAAWHCTVPSDQKEVVRVEFELQIALGLSAKVVSFAIEMDVGCTAGEAPSGLAEGVHPLAIGLKPDGLRVHTGNFGLRMWLALANGAVVYDLLSGLVEHNLTPNGLGAPGINNLDVAAITGGSTLAIFLPSGSGGALRNMIDGNWSYTQLSLQPYTDASTAGNALEAEEMVLASPGRSVEFVAYDASVGGFNFRAGLGLSNPPGGNIISADMPQNKAGSGVLMFSAGTDGGTTSSVYWHDRLDVSAPPVKLVSVNDPNARRIRCGGVAGQRYVCIVTAALLGKAWAFAFDPAKPTAPVTLQELVVGKGSVGVQFGTAADGTLRAAIANHDEVFYNYLAIDAQANVSANQRVALPAGCRRSAHVAVLLYLAQLYTVGTCPDDNAYFVTKVNLF